MDKRPAAPLPTAGEFMTHPVFTLRPDDSVMVALGALLRRGFSGAPVVDGDGRLLGVLSEQDCMRVMASAAFHQLPEGQVHEHMTCCVESISPDLDLFDVVAMLQQGSHRRLPVVSDGRLVGIVARRDVLRALDGLRHAREATAAEPYELRGERRSALRG